MKKRILILNLGGIGDQVLFLPVLESLKKVFKNAFITFVTEPRSESIKDLTGLIDEMFISDLKGKNKFFELFKFLLKARKGRYDIIISSGSSKIVSVILFLTGIKQRIGYDSGLISKILLTKTVPLNQNQYAANMYHDLVGWLNIADEPLIPAIKLMLEPDRQKNIENSINLPENSGIKTVLIHPGVSKLSIEKGIIKFWAVDNWVNLILKLLATGNYKIILTGGSDDEEIAQKLREKLSGLSFNKDLFLDLTNKTADIKEFAYIVNLSDVLVCVDSAPMHIAVGLRKPVIALFGPTDEAKLLPLQNNLFTAIKNNDVLCRPCLWDKRQVSCDKKDCLNIHPDYVFNLLIEKLKGFNI